MLDVLKSIIQDVNEAGSLDDLLKIIVTRVQQTMGTDVFSVYLLDPDSNRYVLMATQGLNQDSVGKVSLGHSEGLVGLVGVREEPINLEHAGEHGGGREVDVGVGTGDAVLDAGVLLVAVRDAHGDGAVVEAPDLVQRYEGVEHETAVAVGVGREQQQTVAGAALQAADGMAQ